MKGIRRSLNKDRIGAPAGATKNGVALPAGNAPRPQAPPAPPKAVIRATAAYARRNSQELSFEEGDFFHVVSDDGGEDWFDASNPMTGKRGMVPADHFQVLGRNARETSMQGRQAKKLSSGSAASVGAGYSPVTTGGQFPAAGGSWKPGVPMAAGISRGPGASAGPPAGGSASSRPGSQSAPRHQPLYGVVQYDFVAERPDELDAKRGEPIIVIAQSNHEWFVAKPIGRLGGPGLIPVAFVQIQDMATGKPVENVEELIRSAVVPKVEEWKKMTADYKQASIPLGRFDFTQPTAQPQPSTSLSSPASANTPLSPPPHSATSSQAQHQSYGGAAAADGGGGYSHPHAGGSQDPSLPDSAGYDNRYSYTRERRQFGLVTSASVESFHQEEGSFWFHLRAFFSTGASLILYRLYQDFYDFQIALMDDFPVEAGRVPGDDGHTERILPMMPGPTEYEDEVVCAQRVHDLSIYLADLCTLPERIRGCGLMYEFLVPRAGDVVIADGDSRSYEEGSARGAGAGGGGGGQVENQYGELVQYLDQMEPASGGDAVAAQLGRMSLNSAGRTQGYDSSSQQPPQQHYYDTPPQTASSAASSYRLPMGNANMDAPFIKIKIFHRNTDDLIAIRVPPAVRHAALLDKVRERLGREVNHLQYREEGVGGARLVGLEDDEELERWVRSGAKLVLYAE
ncbi:hypothetical protein JCM3774_000814 [Rhodotorula dairenensis]